MVFKEQIKYEIPEASRKEGGEGRASRPGWLQGAALTAEGLPGIHQ